jgi:sugar phosphate isomerase/epimerase
MKKLIYKKIYILIIIAMTVITFGTSHAQQKAKDQKSKPDIIVALNAYSFSDLLSAKDEKNHEQVYTLFNLLDWCASRNIKALDPTGYFFPTYPEVPSDEYIQKFKSRAAELGIIISGTGIRNNFASPDSAVRAAGVALAKKWIVVASKMGAPVLRLFAGEIPAGYENKWDEVAGWMIECYKECAVDAQKYGVKIGIQNHGDMLQTAHQCLKVLKAVNSEWVGLIVDIGNFKTTDPYKDIEAVTPFAVNWQVKESPRGLGTDEKTDYVKLIRILKKQGYKGYLPVETLSLKGKSYDPFAEVSKMVSEVNAAIDTVYK